MSALVDMQQVVERAIASAIAAGAAEVDVLAVESDSSEARVRDTVVDFVKQARERGLGIRALAKRDGEAGLSTAVTSTSDLSLDAIDRLAQETVALARATAPDPSAGLPSEAFAEDIPDLGLSDAADRGVDIEARIEDARRAEAAARATDPRITNSEGSQVGSDFSQVTYGNSRGFTGQYDSASHSLFSEPLAQQGESMQRDYWMTVGHKLADLEAPDAVGRKAAERALRRLGARRVATCEVPVIFDARLAPGLIRQLVGCANGGAVYRQATYLADKLGERVAHESVTIIDDGRLMGGLGSKPFDGEGLATRRNVVVENGVLKTFLLDSYSARKLGLASTGNAARGVGSTPGVGTTNLWLEPGGAGSLDDLIAATPRGLLVTELIGMGFNPVNGDYSRGAAGLWIEGGEIAYPVEEITIASDLDTMFKSIDAIGSELEWLGSAAAPPLRIAQMKIAGESE